MGGDHFGGESFPTCPHAWLALLKFKHRPEIAVAIGEDRDPYRTERFRPWKNSAAFFAFLSALGVVKQEAALPKTVEALQSQCGVIPINADLFCGFSCLALLKNLSLKDFFALIERQLAQETANTGRRIHRIAQLALKRFEFAQKQGGLWDGPLLPSEQQYSNEFDVKQGYAG